MGREVIKHTFKFKEQRRTIYLNAASKDEYGRHRGHVLYGMKLTPNGKKIKIGPGAVYTPWGTKIFLDITDPATPGLMEIDLTAAENLPGGVAPDVLNPQYFTDRPVMLAIVCKFDNYQHGFNTSTPDPSGDLPVSEEIGQDRQDNQAGYQAVSELEVTRNLTFLARPVTWDRIDVAPDFNYIALEPIFMNRDPQSEADPTANIYDVRRNYGSASVAPVGGGSSVDGSSIAFDEILLGYVIIGAPEDAEVTGSGLTITGAGGSGGTTGNQFAITPGGALVPVVPGQILNVSGSTDCVNDGAFTILTVDPDTGLVTVSEPVDPDTIGTGAITAAGNDLPQTLGTPTGGWASGISCIQAKNVWESVEDYLGRDVLLGRNSRMVSSSPALTTDDTVAAAPVDVPTSALHQIPGQFNIGLPGVDALALTTLMLAPKYGTTNIDSGTGAFAANWSNYRLPSFMKDGDSLIWVMRRLDYVLRLWMDRTGDQELVGLIQDGTGVGQEMMSPLYKILKNFTGNDGSVDANTNLNKILYADNGDLYAIPGALIGGDPSNRVLKSGPMPHRDFQNSNINTVLGSYFGDNHLGALKALDVAIWNVLENVLGTSVVRSLLRTTASWDQSFFADLPINLLAQPTTFTGNATTGYITNETKLFAAVNQLAYRSERNAGDNLLRNHSFWAVAKLSGDVQFWEVSSGTLARALVEVGSDAWAGVLALNDSGYFQQFIFGNSFDASSISAMGNLLSASAILKNDQELFLQIIGWDGFTEQMRAEVAIPISAQYRTVSLTAAVADAGDTTHLIFRITNRSGNVANVVCLGASLNAGMPNAGPLSRIASDFLSRDGGVTAAMRGDLYMDGNDILTQGGAIDTDGGEIFTGGAQIHGENVSAEGTDQYDFVTLSQIPPPRSVTIGGTGFLGPFDGTGAELKLLAPYYKVDTDVFAGDFTTVSLHTSTFLLGNQLPSITIIRATGDVHIYGKIEVDRVPEANAYGVGLISNVTGAIVQKRKSFGNLYYPYFPQDDVISPAYSGSLPDFFTGYPQAFRPIYRATGENIVQSYTKDDGTITKLGKYGLGGGGGAGTGWGEAQGSYGGTAFAKGVSTIFARGARGISAPQFALCAQGLPFVPGPGGHGGNGSSQGKDATFVAGGLGGRGGGCLLIFTDGDIFLHDEAGEHSIHATGQNGNPAAVPPGSKGTGGGGGGGGGQVGLITSKGITPFPVGDYHIYVTPGNGGAGGGTFDSTGGVGGEGSIVMVATVHIAGIPQYWYDSAVGFQEPVTFQVNNFILHDSFKLLKSPINMASIPYSTYG